MQKYTIINTNCQHNAYLESIKMGQKIEEMPQSIMSKFWSIIDSSLVSAGKLLTIWNATSQLHPIWYSNKLPVVRGQQLREIAYKIYKS